MTSEFDKFTWKNKENIAIIASIVVGTAITAIYLWITNLAFTSDKDLTNIFTFTIEIGIAIFISILIFQYSRYQQSRSDRMLKSMKAVQEGLKSERGIRKEIYQKALINCFLSIWMECKLIMLNLDFHGALSEMTCMC